MDLKTIETRLCDGFYKSADSFARDVRLVFANAQCFYKASDKVRSVKLCM
jgi:hypothetical protein